jgi:hypothetical protein
VSWLTEGQAKLLDLPGLATFLTETGRPARLLTEPPPDLDRLDAYVLSLSGSPIDRISLRMRGVVGPGRNLRRGAGFLTVGMVPLASRAVLPVQTHLILDTSHDPGPAVLAWASSGFFKRERTGLAWSGGPLAAALQADEVLTALLIIRVVLRRDVVVEFGVMIPGLGRAHRAAWTPGLLELLERVAAHARGWLG